MLVIGITGGLGSGKSTVAAMFARLGAVVIDADVLAHHQLQKHSPSFSKIVKMFDKEILTQGRINREKLAQIVFRDPCLRKKLERIIHPEVKKTICHKVEFYRKMNAKVVVVDVPLLFESKWNRFMDVNIVVKTTLSVQIERSIKNLSITKAEALRRIRAQMPLKQKIALADIIINNIGTRAQTQKQVNKIWKNLI